MNPERADVGDVSRKLERDPAGLTKKELSKLWLKLFAPGVPVGEYLYTLAAFDKLALEFDGSLYEKDNPFAIKKLLEENGVSVENVVIVRSPEDLQNLGEVEGTVFVIGDSILDELAKSAHGRAGNLLREVETEHGTKFSLI